MFARMLKMWWSRGEDDGSVLKYVTEDEPKRAPQIEYSRKQLSFINNH